MFDSLCTKAQKTQKVLGPWHNITILSVQLFNDKQTDQVANKNHKALPSASVDKWGCHIKSGTRVDEVSLTLQHSVISDDVVVNLRDYDFQGNMECNPLSLTQGAIAFFPVQDIWTAPV